MKETTAKRPYFVTPFKSNVQKKQIYRQKLRLPLGLCTTESPAGGPLEERAVKPRAAERRGIVKTIVFGP